MMWLCYTYRAIFDSDRDADSKRFTRLVKIVSVVAPGLIWFALAAPFENVPCWFQLSSVVCVDDARLLPCSIVQSMVATVLAFIVLVIAARVVVGRRGSRIEEGDNEGTRDRALLFFAFALFIVGLLLAFLDAIGFDNRWEEIVLAFSAFCMLAEEVRLLRKYRDSMVRASERVEEAKNEIETMHRQTKESVEKIPDELVRTIRGVFSRREASGEEEHGRDSGGDGRS